MTPNGQFVTVLCHFIPSVEERVNWSAWTNFLSVSSGPADHGWEDRLWSAEAGCVHIRA